MARNDDLFSKAKESAEGPRQHRVTVGPCPSNSCDRCAGGWIPIVLPNTRGVPDGRRARVDYFVFACDCETGYWMYERGRILGPKCNTFADLPTDVKIHYAPLVTLYEINAMNRLREVELKKQIGIPYFDYETTTWHGFPEDKKKRPEQNMTPPGFRGTKESAKEILAGVSGVTRGAEVSTPASSGTSASTVPSEGNTKKKRKGGGKNAVADSKAAKNEGGSGQNEKANVGEGNSDAPAPNQTGSVFF